MPRPTRMLILLGFVSVLCACGAGHDEAMRRLDEQAQHLSALEQQVEALRTGEAALPDLTAEDLPRLEKDMEALHQRLVDAQALAAEAQTAVRRHESGAGLHQLAAVRARYEQSVTRLAALESELAGALVELQRREDRKSQRDWDPMPDELLAAENTAQVVRLDASMRELLFAIDQEHVTQEEANPELRYLMNQRELEVRRQARLMFDSRLAEVWERVNQLEAQTTELNKAIAADGPLLAALEADEAQREALLARQAALVAQAEQAEHDLQRVQTLVTRAKLAGQ